MTDPSGPESHHCRGFRIAVRHTTLRRTPLGESSAPRRDLYPTTHKTHNRQTPTPLTEFEPAIPASEQPQTKSPNRLISILRHFIYAPAANYDF